MTMLIIIVIILMMMECPISKSCSYVFDFFYTKFLSVVLFYFFGVSTLKFFPVCCPLAHTAFHIHTESGVVSDDTANNVQFNSIINGIMCPIIIHLWISSFLRICLGIKSIIISNIRTYFTVLSLLSSYYSDTEKKKHFLDLFFFGFFFIIWFVRALTHIQIKKCLYIICNMRKESMRKDLWM